MKTLRLAAVLVAGVLIGWLVGPPIANAVTSLVKIQSCCSTAVASVSAAHRLAVGTGYLTNSMFALTEPSGELVITQGSTSVSKPSGTNPGDIVGASVDVYASAGSAPVTVEIRKGTTIGSGIILWEGTVPEGVGHVDWSLGNSIYFPVGTGFNVTVVNTGAAAVQYDVYGFGFGVTTPPGLPPRPSG